MLSFSQFAELYGAYEIYIAGQNNPQTPAVITPQNPTVVMPQTPAAITPQTAGETDIVKRLEALEKMAVNPSVANIQPEGLDDIVNKILGGGTNGK